MDNPTNKKNDFSKLNLFPKKCLLSPCFSLPTSFLALFLIILIAYNSLTIFFYFVPVLQVESSNETKSKLPDSQVPSSKPYAVKEETPRPMFSKMTRMVISRRSPTSFTQTKSLKRQQPKQASKTTPPPEDQPRGFSKRVKQFFLENSCKVRFFMTWISSLESFTDREMFCIESLFKFHPNACLLIVSDSMDTYRGTQILLPFLRMNFKVMAISPEFRFLLKNTMAAEWYGQLEKGNIKKGDISIGQNLSNLVRLALLYKYGGIYMDTDFIVLKRLNKLRNTIGAQTEDPQTHRWSRLNNALLIFDKKHPLLSKFMEEFALTFNGNKWGHNGPYLVSRVVERLNGSMESVDGFTILPSTAFYVVDWVRIGSFFQGPKDELGMQWMNSKLKQIEEKSYAVHLWNRQSRAIRVENGSIISHLMKGSCVFCNDSTAIL